MKFLLSFPRRRLTSQGKVSANRAESKAKDEIFAFFLEAPPNFVLFFHIGFEAESSKKVLPLHGIMTDKSGFIRKQINRMEYNNHIFTEA